MRRYLLGELSEEEQVGVRERLFLDVEYFQNLQIAEEELIDDYIYDDLSSAERERFEDHFLSAPERRESVRIARALKKYTSTNVAATDLTGDDLPGTSWWIFPTSFPAFSRPMTVLSLAAVVLLAVLGVTLFVIRFNRPSGRQNPVQVQAPAPNEKEQHQTPLSANQQEQRARTDDPGGDKGRQANRQAEAPPLVVEKDETPANRGRKDRVRQSPTPGREPPTRVYSFLLLPLGSTRGGGDSNRLEIPADAGTASLQLPLLEENKYQSYQASLLADDGKTLRVWAGLKPSMTSSGEAVTVPVPVKLLSSHSYKMNLSGVTADGNLRDISTYSFQVAKK